jgi:hypothetical protein
VPVIPPADRTAPLKLLAPAPYTSVPLKFNPGALYAPVPLKLDETVPLVAKSIVRFEKSTFADIDAIVE